jgi:hypothetical protein
MAKNRPKEPIKKARRRLGFFGWVERTIKMEQVFEGGLPVRYLPYVLFLVFLGLFYIGNSHYADKTNRKISKLEREVEDLRADYTTLKSDYMYSSKQSEVAKKVKELGLFESLEPPHKIEIKKGEY